VEELRGNFYADFELSGHPRQPQIDGIAYVKNAQLKYFDLANEIYSDSAGVTMHNDSIIVDRIEVYATERDNNEGRKHYAYIDGSMKLLAIDSLYYDLDIRLDNEFPFVYELDDIRGKVEGELQVRGATPPTVTGDIELVSAQYRVPFADESSGSPLMMALFSENPWDLNINVDILSNYWVKNEDIDAEFAGEINLIRERGSYRFLGEMEILRGRGFLVDKTFRLEPGGRVIFTGGDTLNPQLDITGTSRVLAARVGADEGPATEQVDLCIHVGGTLNKPEINPCEGSDVAQADILPLIVSNYRGGDGIGLGGQVEGRLFGLGYAQFSQIGGRQLNRIGVETFEIDPVYGESLDPWNAWITVGKYVGEGLYVYLRSTLAGQTRQEGGFEYRMSKNLLMEGRRDEDELYHLNVRLHWEFGGDRKDDKTATDVKKEGDSE
jgi:autotransporter translocation and assembly factor TamB